jgi:hypothetical protein
LRQGWCNAGVQVQEASVRSFLYLRRGGRMPTGSIAPVVNTSILSVYCCQVQHRHAEAYVGVLPRMPQTDNNGTVKWSLRCRTINKICQRNLSMGLGSCRHPCLHFSGISYSKYSLDVRHSPPRGPAGYYQCWHAGAWASMSNSSALKGASLIAINKKCSSIMANGNNSPLLCSR